MVQYVSPTIQLMLGVWVFGEPFDTTRLAGFVPATELQATQSEAERQAVKVQF